MTSGPRLPQFSQTKSVPIIISPFNDAQGVPNCTGPVRFLPRSRQVIRQAARRGAPTDPLALGTDPVRDETSI